MSQPLTVALPPDIDLWDSCIVRVTAVSPTSGAVVSGVNVQNVTLHIVQLAGGEAELVVGGWQLVPGPGA